MAIRRTRKSKALAVKSMEPAMTVPQVVDLRINHLLFKRSSKISFVHSGSCKSLQYRKTFHAVVLYLPSVYLHA